jgi:hypothetical protein
VPSASSRLDSLQASAITEFAFIDICIRGLCQPEQAVSFRRRLRANFPLALHWSALRHFLGITVCVFPSCAHPPTTSRFLTLYFLAVIFVFTQTPAFFVVNGSSTPTSFSLSLVSLFCSPSSHILIASVRPYTKPSSPVQFFIQHKYWWFGLPASFSKELLASIRNLKT